MADSELYSSLLFPKGHGYPLFHPQPFDDLPERARRIGTEIGDVGLVTQDGSFDPIFNILYAADHPVNRFGVPAGFTQVVLRSEDIATRELFHSPGSHISNTAVNKRRLDIETGVDSNVFLPLGAGAVVEVSASSKQTGLLILPDGASRWDLRPLQIFRDYALKHAQNWYIFVNSALQRMVGNGDLYLVTGVTKCTTWSVAAVEDQSNDTSISLRLKAAQVGNAGATCAWEWETSSSSVDSGPRRYPGEDSWRDNQTVFLRGFKVAVRLYPLKRSPKIRSIVKSKWQDVQPKNTSVPYSRSTNSSASTDISRSSSSRTGWGEVDSDDERSVESVSDSYHPSTCINDYLLSHVPHSAVAVTHDDEWAAVLKDTDNRIPGDSDLLIRVLKRFAVDSMHCGVYLKARSEDDFSSDAITPNAHETAVDESLSQFAEVTAETSNPASTHLDKELLAKQGPLRTRSPPAVDTFPVPPYDSASPCTAVPHVLTPSSFASAQAPVTVRKGMAGMSLTKSSPGSRILYCDGQGRPIHATLERVKRSAEGTLLFEVRLDSGDLATLPASAVQAA